MVDSKGWPLALSLAIVGIVGAWLGSAVQHYLSLERERRTAFEERQSDAYVAFLTAFDKYRVAADEELAGNSGEAAALRRAYELEVGAAGRRIAVFGDGRVVQAMARWHRAYGGGGQFPCDERLSSEVALWEGMRGAVLGRRQSVTTGDIALITTRCSVGETR